MLRTSLKIYNSSLPLNIIRNFTLASRLKTIKNYKQFEQTVSVTFNNDEKHEYHYRWLRDNCSCKECYNAIAHEWLVNILKIPPEIKPKQIHLIGEDLSVTWPDNHTSRFNSNWLKQHCYGKSYNAFVADNIDRVYWNHSIRENIPQSFVFDDVLSEDKILLSLLETIEKYGFTIVSSTPTNISGMTMLGKRLGILHDNLYGDAVSLVTNQSTVDDLKDLAYSNEALNTHTDGGYFIEAPGLQAFHCHEHTGEGGETVLVDGIRAAYELKEKNIDAFNILAEIKIPMRFEDRSFYQKNYDSMIKYDSISQQIYQVRINEGHRDTMTGLEFKDIDKFYDALSQFLTILRSTEKEFWFKLTPGNCLIVNNWRVLHGRASFTGTRTLSGFYIEKGDYLSNLKTLQRKLK